eukprot:284046_1
MSEHVKEPKLGVGDYIITHEGESGIVKFIGNNFLQHNETLMVGFETEYMSFDNLHDGALNGKRYFKCQQGYGRFRRLNSVWRYLKASQFNINHIYQQWMVYGSNEPYEPKYSHLIKPKIYDGVELDTDNKGTIKYIGSRPVIGIELDKYSPSAHGENAYFKTKRDHSHGHVIFKTLGDIKRIISTPIYKKVPFPSYGDNRTAFLFGGSQLIMPQKSTIDIYDISSNKWRTNVVDELKEADRFTFDADKQCLYGYCNECIRWCDIEEDDIYRTQTLTTGLTKLKLDLNGNVENITNYHPSSIKLRTDSGCIVIKIGCVHHIISERPSFETEIIGGSTHAIWDECRPENVMKTVHKLHVFDFPRMGYRAVYIESKSEILIFGGNRNGVYTDTIWRYPLSKKHWKFWEMLDSKMPEATNDFACVMTNDERYIIILGGETQKVAPFWSGISRRSQNIHILDVFKMKWMKSKVKLPDLDGLSHISSAVIDDKIIYRLIKYQCNVIGVKEIPIDVVQLIEAMHGKRERIHLFDHYGKDHWVISVADILKDVVNV